jgi:hypothetical protein
MTVAWWGMVVNHRVHVINPDLGSFLHPGAAHGAHGTAVSFLAASAAAADRRSGGAVHKHSSTPREVVRTRW